MTVQKLSIEVTNQCQKGCSFCYNKSNTSGTSNWTRSNLVDFILDCKQSGTEAVSFGGGEPLLFEGIFDVLAELTGLLFRSLTTNGLLLDDSSVYRALMRSRPEKVHISIHNPADREEVTRTIRQVKKLEDDGVSGGINLLVHHSSLEETRHTSEQIRLSGIGSRQVIYIPRHGEDSPSAEEVAYAAGQTPFQSVSCLQGCRRKPGFCAVGWDQKVGWCSYTSSRKLLNEPTASGLEEALTDLQLTPCGANLPRL